VWCDRDTFCAPRPLFCVQADPTSLDIPKNSKGCTSATLEPAVLALYTIFHRDHARDLGQAQPQLEHGGPRRTYRQPHPKNHHRPSPVAHGWQYCQITAYKSTQSEDAYVQVMDDRLRDTDAVYLPDQKLRFLLTEPGSIHRSY